MKRFLTPLLILILYAIAACIITYPLVTGLTTHFLGHPFGDSLEYAGHIGWMVQALRTGQNPFVQPLLLYPHGLEASWLWAVPLQSLPAVLLMLAFELILPASAALPLAFNLSALLTIALNGWSMYLLARHLIAQADIGNWRAKPYAAFLAGLVYLSFPVFQGHMGAGHIGLLALWGAPMFALFMLRIAEQEARKRDILGAAVCFCLSALGSTTLLIFMMLPITLVILWHSRRNRPVLRAQFGALITGGMLLAIFVSPFIFRNFVTEFAQPTVRLNANSVRYSAPLLGIVSPSPQHPLYRALDYPGAVIGGEPFENTAYLGVIGGLLALIGAVRLKSARAWLVMAMAAWVLSLGALLKIDANVFFAQIDGRAGPIALPYVLVQALPFVDFTRTPARFDFAIGFALAVMAGYGAAILLARARRLALPVTAIAAALILFDVQTWWPMPLISAEVPDAIASLGESDARAIFDVPFDHPLVDKEALYLQTAHHLPIIGGHIARETPLDPAMGTLLQNTLDPALLDAAGVDVILLHRDWDDGEGALEAHLRTAFGDPAFEDEHFAVFRVPPYAGDPPQMVQFAPTDGTPASSTAVYVYMPQDGTYTLTGQIAGAANRGMRLLIDGGNWLDMRWSIPESGTHGLRVPIDLPAGYHTLTLTVDPPCVVPPAPMLICPTFTTTDLALLPSSSLTP